MTRLMCSKDRQEVEALESKLFKAGIRSEIRSNPITEALGITRLEIYIHERDLPRASKVRQAYEATGSSEDAPGGRENTREWHGLVEQEPSELVIEAETLPSHAAEPPRDDGPRHRRETAEAGPEGEFALAAASLEKEVEELLARESKLVNRCASLEEKAKALDESLAQARAELAREVSNSSRAEKKLAEACETRASLEKQMQALGLRLKAAEQALAASQARLDSQVQELSVHQARIADLKKEASSRDAQLERMAESLAQARAGMEQEKKIRLAAEQKSGELAAARKSLERQLAQQAQLREQLLSERKEEQERMQACVGTVNDLHRRLRARLAAREKQ